MKEQYVLGVDGGNTKTDFVLADGEGRVVAALKTGTCSHEALPDSFDGARRTLGEHLHRLIEGNGIDREQVSSAVLGLAGIDTRAQQERLTDIIGSLGFRRFLAVNDSYLSIKALSHTGSGVCSINGTGTVVGGIDSTGKLLQIGGIGVEVTGDCGGGNYYASRTIRAAYDQLFRNGPDTGITAPVLALLGVGDPGDFMEKIRERFLDKRNSSLGFMQILFSACEAGDKVARTVVEQSAAELANSVIGCVNRLEFSGEIPLVCAGSIWIKCETPLLYGRFCRILEQQLGGRVKPVKLNAPPVCGAVHWAYQERPEPYCFQENLNVRIAEALALASGNKGL